MMKDGDKIIYTGIGGFGFTKYNTYTILYYFLNEVYVLDDNGDEVLFLTEKFDLDNYFWDFFITIKQIRMKKIKTIL